MLVRGDEGRDVPVELHAAALRGPLAAVPDAEMHAHGLVVGVLEAGYDALQVAEHANRRVVDIEHQQVLVPLEVIVVERRGGVEAQVDLLLAATDAVHEDVRMQQERLAGFVAEEFEVEFAMVGSLGRHLQSETVCQIKNLGRRSKP